MEPAFQDRDTNEFLQLKSFIDKSNGDACLRMQRRTIGARRAHSWWVQSESGASVSGACLSAPSRIEPGRYVWRSGEVRTAKRSAA
jgi:hypothetical protein